MSFFSVHIKLLHIATSILCCRTYRLQQFRPHMTYIVLVGR